MYIITSLTEIAVYWRRNNKINTLKQTYLVLEKRKNTNIYLFIYLIDLLNLFFLPYFSVQKIGEFHISKMLDKFFENVAVKYSNPEAAPVSNKSKIIDFQEVEKLC